MSRRHAAAASIVVAGLVCLYAGVMSSLVAHWASDDNYSHGFFVLPLAAFFGWERRSALANATSRPSAAGLLLIALSLGAYMAGVLGAEIFLTRVSLLGVLAGAVLFVWGRQHFRIVALPIAFLLLMIPLPQIIFNQVAFPLQLLASRAGEAAIAAAGVPVLREGNVLQLPNTTLEVVEACSGIRSLVSLLTLALVLGYFADNRIGARVAIGLAAVPIAILANAVRVAGTGLASHWLGAEAAEGFFHSFSGWMVFVVAFAGLIAFQHLVARIRPSAMRHRPALRLEPR